MRRQAGFTLTELMVAIGLGLSVISSVLIGYLATYTSSVSTLAGSKLNQDMSVLINLMVSELRRAGYFSDLSAGRSGAEGSGTTYAASNPFSRIDDTALEVFDNMTSNKQQAATGSGSCIVYSYDSDEDGTVDAEELSGFRLTRAGVVQMRTSGNTNNPDTCATTSNSWTELTDPGFLAVSTLTFDLANSQCLNTREPDGLDNDLDGTVDEAGEADCYASIPATGSGDITVETREVRITLTATLANDSFTRLTRSQTVRARNDLVRLR